MQYHFGNKEQLLQAILEFRESEMEASRKRLLQEVENSDAGDVNALLRAIFEPYARMFLDHGDMGFIKLITSYLNHVRPRGQVLHPADYADESFPYLHEAILRLRVKLSKLDDVCFQQRIDSMGAMFYGAFIQYSSRAEENRMNRYELLEDTLRMMSAAMESPSRPVVS